MLEALLTTKRKLSDYLIDIDFSRQAVGDTLIDDWGGNDWALSLGSGVNPVVIEDPTMGNVMEFSGSGYFSIPITTALQLNQQSFFLEIVMKPGTTYSKVFGNGDYPSPSGFVVSVNQYTSTYIQMFIEISGSSFYRILPTLSNNGSWETVQYNRHKGGNITAEIYRNNTLTASASRTDLNIANGTRFYLGTTPGAPGSQLFKGLIKSVKLGLLAA